MVETKQDAPGVLAPPPLLLAGSLGVAFALGAMVPVGIGGPTALRWVVAALLAEAGIGVALWAILRFRAARTNVEPWKPSTALVTDGPSRFTRNPMYLGMALLHVAVALAADSVWPLVTLVGFVWVMTRFVIEREERYLEAKFGAPVAERRAPRWIGLPHA